MSRLLVPFNFSRREGGRVSKTLSEFISSYYSKKASTGNKLVYVDDRFEILRRGQTVLDLGSFPGNWLRVLKDRVVPENHRQERGSVLAVDRIKFNLHIDRVEHLQLDVFDEDFVEKIGEKLKNRHLDVILSDLSPRRVALRDLDHEAQMALLLCSSRLLETFLRTGGSFVCKVLYGKETGNWRTYLETRFESVNTAKPDESKGMEEFYLVCRNFFGRRNLESDVETRGDVGFLSKEGREPEFDF